MSIPSRFPLPPLNLLPHRSGPESPPALSPLPRPPDPSAFSPPPQDLATYEKARREAAQAGGKDKHFMARSTMAAAFTHGTAPSSLEGLRRACLADVARRVNKIQLGAVLFARVARRAHRNVGRAVELRGSH